MKIAYCITAYQEPQRTIRIVKRLITPQDHFYIHFDKSIGKQKFFEWKKLINQELGKENIEVDSKFYCKWGSFGLTASTLSAMNHFEKYEYDYLLNLTGDCYPLKTPQQIKAELKNQTSGYMTYWKMPYQGWGKGGMDRIRNNHYFFHKKEYPYVKILKIPRIRRKLPANLEPYGGWNWFALPKQLVNYTVQFVEKNPSVEKFYKHAFAPGEMFFQTVLLNSPFKDRIVNDNKRYVEFIDSHPRTLTIKDHEALKQSGKLFARKFNPKIDSQILDAIDKDLEHYKPTAEKDEIANEKEPVKILNRIKWVSS
jgi:hypothetical protein